ncbi:MAG: hypothetical protein OEW75_04570, partial [Cyclobacteriaceae bacterium]|nr:hypothetical protein [Cyclobacteriaceae bacterium]
MKPSYSKIPFSLERKQIVDFLSIAKAKHTAYAVIDFDITGVRNDLRKVKRHFNKKASLTGYLIYSFAKAVAEDKSIQAYRMGNQTIIFD